MTLRTALLIIALFTAAAGFSQTISINKRNAALTAVMKEIERQTAFKFFYKQQLLKNSGNITIDVKDASLESVLALCFKALPVDYRIVGNQIVLSAKPAVPPKKEVATDAPATGNAAQGLIRIAGIVAGSNNQPLAGATVTIEKQNTRVQTDEKGAFSIMAPPNSHLIVSYVGHKAMREKVIPGNTMLIRLESNAVLDEAVVYNGYQKIKQKFLTGSVTSLKMDSIIQPGLTTVDKMLEGRVPGLTYMQNSGQAGAAPKLRIRGTSTYMGNREPLWVVDGVRQINPVNIPADRINDPDFVNLLGNAISGLNPNDIDQIDILKDATAAALYGVRGANGVIVVTTKRGKAGPPRVNYTVTGKYTRRPRYTDNSVNMMNSLERVDVSREMIRKHMPLRGGVMEAYEKSIAAYYAGEIDYATFQQQVNKAETINTDWMDVAMKDVLATDHTLSVSGGNPSAIYNVSLGYSTDNGVIKKELNDRYTANMNLTLNYKKVQAVFQVKMFKTKRRYTPQEVKLLNYVHGTSRAIPVYNEDGSLYFYSTINSMINPGSNTQNIFMDLRAMNIVNEMEKTGETVETNQLSASAMFTYEIARGIQWQTNLSYIGSNTDQQKWFEENTEWVADKRRSGFDPVTRTYDLTQTELPLGGELQRTTTRPESYNISTRLDFNRYIDSRDNHLLAVSAGVDLLSDRSYSFRQIHRGYYPERGYTFAEIPNYSRYTNWLVSSGRPTLTKILSNSLRTYLTATYSFKDRFVFSATSSQEFSNAFGARSNEKFLPTWALSGRWNIHTDLLRNISWIDQADLRVSYGLQGNMPNNPTPYAIIQKGALNPYYNTFSSDIISYPNPDLLWEKKYDYNASLNFSLLRGRINGYVGYYYSKTVNAFLEKKVSAINGVNAYTVNGGILDNRGIELALNFKIIDNIGKTGNKKGFAWRFDPQLGQVLNRVINNNLRSRNVIVDDALLTYADFLAGQVPVNGKAVNTFYSYRFKSLDPNYGFPIFYGAEPEKKAELIAQYNTLSKEGMFNMVMIESGKREPVIQGGIGNTFMYRNWSLNILFSYSIGNKVRLMQIASGDYGTFRPSSQQNLRGEFTERWRYPGDEKFTNIPGIQGSSEQLQFDQLAWWINSTPKLNYQFATDYYQMYDFSDLRVINGDYIKLQSVNLSYWLPKELCSEWNINGAAVSLSGSNLFTIANKAFRGQDPATQSGSSPGINLSTRPVYSFTINLTF